MKEKLKKIISNKLIISGLLIAISIGSSIKLLTVEPAPLPGAPIKYTEYNNYMIFKYSFLHLINNNDLYKKYPHEHYDLYKYTPTFALAFGAFGILPDWLGLILWNLFNSLILILAIYYLPRLNIYQKGLILLIIANELFTSIQSSQTNALITGLLIFAFICLENKKIFWAPLFITASVFIKIFGILGFALLLFYPEKWKLILYSIFWSIVLFLLPLIFIDFSQYMELFTSYGQMLTNDHSTSYGYSVMGIMHTWFELVFNKNAVVLAGAFIFLLPLVKYKMYKDYNFRLLTLISILIWLIIFNHKAESPTFIIAMTGIAIWFINSEKNKLNIALFVFAFIFTSMSPTDIFPPVVRKQFFETYAIKALPCVLIWFKIIYDMVTMGNILVKTKEIDSNAK